MRDDTCPHPRPLPRGAEEGGSPSPAQRGREGTHAQHGEGGGNATPYTLHFPQLDRAIPARPGETVFHAARRSGVRIVGACGGRGTCGTCAVRIGPDRKWARACQAMPDTDAEIEVAPRSLAPVVRTEPNADTAETLPLAPAVIDRDIAVAEATLSDTTGDLDRLARALDLPVGAVDIATARALPGVLRHGGWRLRARLRGGELIGVAPVGARTLGLAIDLGTTNAAGFLIDLRTGVRLASLGIENPQTAWGADLISRINHAVRNPDAAEELRRSAVDAVNALAHDLCRAVEADPSDVVDVAVCANTAMHHLLMGLPVRQLGRAPFVAAVRDAVDVKARDLGLTVAPGAWVHLAPNVGGFVGGDHVTALLATESEWSAHATALVMDIGTNTEISLIHRGAILSASCPSGPALEGGNISCGMRAAEGAIERVSAGADGLVLGVIGGREPVGLCGSGVLDALATLRAVGAVDGRGRLAAGHPLVREADGKRAAELAPGVRFTQDDVRAVQLAKAAIRTGVELLLREAGLHENDIGRFIIAGAFGAYIDVASGVGVGLFPDLPAERFVQVGNAAGLGVRRMLASRHARDRARDLAARCRYVELSTRADFQKNFLNNIGFSGRIPS
ncbi:ASKHA domain-containing protein [Azospirillum sp. TSO22-1]|uniref:ASKHA domain-containing protein n=1 Tax=Azospirillum sp. TSO22-1 TaxID=716789 RepID=UPI000D64C711|nr:ASKHA domain-containing protein [Azospirillum sp. TSO22-1]